MLGGHHEELETMLQTITPSDHSFQDNRLRRRWQQNLQRNEFTRVQLIADDDTDATLTNLAAQTIDLNGTALAKIEHVYAQLCSVARRSSGASKFGSR